MFLSVFFRLSSVSFTQSRRRLAVYAVRLISSYASAEEKLGRASPLKSSNEGQGLN